MTIRRTFDKLIGLERWFSTRLIGRLKRLMRAYQQRRQMVGQEMVIRALCVAWAFVVEMLDGNQLLANDWENMLHGYGSERIEMDGTYLCYTDDDSVEESLVWDIICLMLEEYTPDTDVPQCAFDLAGCHAVMAYRHDVIDEPTMPNVPPPTPKAPSSMPKAPASMPKAPSSAPQAPATVPNVPMQPQAPPTAPKAPPPAPQPPFPAPQAPMQPIEPAPPIEPVLCNVTIQPAVPIPPNVSSQPAVLPIIINITLTTQMKGEDIQQALNAAPALNGAQTVQYYFGNIGQKIDHIDKIGKQEVYGDGQCPAKAQVQRDEEQFHFIHPAVTNDDDRWQIHDEVKNLLKNFSVMAICDYLDEMNQKRRVLLPIQPLPIFTELQRMGLPESDGYSYKNFTHHYHPKRPDSTRNAEND